MKNLKKKFILLMCMLLIPTLLVACKAKPVAPEESAKILYDVFIKSDQTNISKLGLDKSGFEKYTQERKDTSIKQYKSEFTSQGLTVSDAQLEEIYNAIVESYKKATATTEVVTKTDSTAVVKIKTTYIDLMTIATKAGTDAAQSVRSSGVSGTALKSKLVEAYINNLVAGIKGAEISADTKEKEFDFSLNNNVWLPLNQEQFYVDLDALVSGQVMSK